MLFLLQLELGLGLVPCLDLDPRAGILAVFALHVPFAGAAGNRDKPAHLDLHLLGRVQLTRDLESRRSQGRKPLLP